MSDPSTSLDQLHDLVPPPGISWWPLAPGWYVVVFCVLVLVGVLGFRAWKSWRENAYRRAALLALENASDVLTIAEILRRTALVVVPRSLVANMTGESWTDWLASVDSNPMPDTVRRQLTRGIYDRPDPDTDCIELRRYAIQWIRQHGILA